MLYRPPGPLDRIVHVNEKSRRRIQTTASPGRRQKTLLSHKQICFQVVQERILTQVSQRQELLHPEIMEFENHKRCTECNFGHNGIPEVNVDQTVPGMLLNPIADVTLYMFKVSKDIQIFEAIFCCPIRARRTVAKERRDSRSQVDPKVIALVVDHR